MSELSSRTASLLAVLVQIGLLDVVFSLDFGNYGRRHGQTEPDRPRLILLCGRQLPREDRDEYDVIDTEHKLEDC